MKIAYIAVPLLSLATSLAQGAPLAKVNDKVISEQDLRLAMTGVSDIQADSVLGDIKSKKQILNSVIDQELMVQKAESNQLQKSAEYRTAMENFQRQLLVNLLVEKEIAPRLTETAAKEYYKTHRSEFSTSRVHAQHVLLSSEKEAKRVLASVKSGKDIQEIAEKISIDPSAKNNRGDLGFFPRGRMVPEFSEPVFAAKDGEVIGPIKTAFGYHVVKVVEKKLGQPLEYDEVELQVKAAMRRDLVQNYVSQLRKTSKVEVFLK